MSSEGSEIVLRGAVFVVERLTVPLRGGGEAKREIVRHPGAVCVLGVLDDGSLVTIRNFRIATGRWMVEFCAGKLEPGECPEEAARRELEEETGFSAARIEPLGKFYTSPGFTDELMHAFVATGLSPCALRHQSDERIEVVLRTASEFEAMIVSGEVADGKSIAAYSLWRLMPR
ncbi:MAG: NUDIX hydrolase [Phycisphaerales bacterium]|nr:NUDIX hydrolase [Phycisphaerales bacterium]